jgi:hypothetical protein
MSDARKVRMVIDPPLTVEQRARLRDVAHGDLRDFHTNELLISATVDYIVAALGDPRRNLTLVETIHGTR